jgi:hypothetical protein
MVPPAGSASSRSHPAPGGASKPRAAWWNRASSPAIDANAWSVWHQAGEGGQATSPGMNTSRSRPSGSMPTGSGTPSKPAPRTWRNSAWTSSVCGPDGRRRYPPSRVTAPAFAMPPWRASGSATRRTAPTGRYGPARLMAHRPVRQGSGREPVTTGRRRPRRPARPQHQPGVEVDGSADHVHVRAVKHHVHRGPVPIGLAYGTDLGVTDDRDHDRRSGHASNRRASR